MNPLTLLFRLPLLPLQGVIRLAQLIQEDVEREMADPSKVRRELEDVEQAEGSGVISDQQASELQYEVTAQYLEARGTGTTVADDDEG
jgi:hypothetical protein